MAALHQEMEKGISGCSTLTKLSIFGGNFSFSRVVSEISVCRYVHNCTWLFLEPISTTLVFQVVNSIQTTCNQLLLLPIAIPTTLVGGCCQRVRPHMQMFLPCHYSFTSIRAAMALQGSLTEAKWTWCDFTRKSNIGVTVLVCCVCVVCV